MQRKPVLYMLLSCYSSIPPIKTFNIARGKRHDIQGL